MPSLELEALLNISQIDLTKGLDQILQEVLDIVRDEMAARAASIMLVNDEPGVLELAAVSGLPDDYIKLVYDRGVPITSSPSGVVLETGEYYVVPNIFEEPKDKPWADLGRELNFSSQMFMPLKRKGAVIGVMVVYMADPHEFTQDEIAFVGIAASQSAVVIENARYSGHLEALVNARTTELKASNECLLQEINERKRIEENLKGLLNISQIDLTKPLREILEEILAITGGEMNAHSGTIMLVNDEIGELEMVATFGLPEDYIARIYSTGVPITTSPSGVVLETGHYYLVPNLFEEPKDEPWHDISRELGFSAQIFMPMKAGGEVIGLLNIYKAEPHDFAEDEIAFVTVAASQAAAVIENAKYSGQLEELVNERTAELNLSNEHLLKEITERKRVEENLKGLSKISQIDLTKELNQILKEILTITGGEMGAHSGTIMLANEETGELEMVATFGLPEDYIARIYSTGVPITTSPSGVVLETGHYYLVPNLFEEPKDEPWRDLGRELGFSAQIFMPMKAGGEVIGLLNIYMAKEHEFAEDEINFVSIAASQAAAIIEDARLYAKVLQKKEELESEIGERKRIEEALQESEEKYRTFFKTSRDAVFITSKEGRLIDVNNAAVKLYGYESKAELQKVNLAILYKNPEDRKRFIQIMEQQGFIEDVAFEFRKKDGSTFYGLATAVAKKDENENVIAFQGIVRDITERKRMEEELRQSEATHRTIFESTGLPTVILNEDGTFYRVNTEGAKISGYPKEELEGKKSWTEFIAKKEDLERMKEIHQLRREDPAKAPMNYEFLFKDRYGNLRNIYVTAAIISGTTKSVVSFMDITERKQAEEELRASEERYRRLFNGITDAVFVHPVVAGGMPPGKFIEVNDVACQKLGYTHEELLKLSHFDISAPEAVEKIPAIREQLLAAKNVLFETVAVTKDGHKIPLEVNTHQFDLKGQPCVFSIARDVTERKRAEEALRESEERFRSFFDNLSVGVAMRDPDGYIIAVNKTLCSFVGYSQEELIGKHFSDLTCSEDLNKSEEFYSSLSKGDRDSYLIDKRYVRKDGELVWGRLYISGIRDKDGELKYATVICEDITEYKRVEEALLTKKKELENAMAEVTRVEDALKKTERKYKEIAEFLPDLIYKSILIDS